ncbi:MAG: YhbY family RNA-binding protein, partial [Candidatus Aphodousia sp.]|nr:YhbY family RNA-binding protein [Candidatus Aphodousia sp.]
MAELLLDRDTRLQLRAEAHGLDPVVLLGANGLTEAVIKEVDRALLAHELIKIRVPGDEREEREAIYN